MNNFRQMASRIASAVLKLAHKPVLAPMGLNRQAVQEGNGTMLYFIDQGANHSKFYEMLIVPHGAGFWLLKRWGALTDSLGSGRVDSKDEVFRTIEEAQQAMKAHAASKTRKGYVSAFGPYHKSPSGETLKQGEYPVGLKRPGAFGWGEQAVVRSLDVLKDIHNLIKEAIEDIGGNREKLISDLFDAQLAMRSLEDTDSTMAAKLSMYLNKAYRTVKNDDRYDQNDVRLTLNTIDNYLRKQMSTSPNARMAGQMRPYYRPIYAVCAEIADEVVRKGESKGWRGSDFALQTEIAQRLARFNIGYTDDMFGTWEYVRGGTPSSFDRH